MSIFSRTARGAAFAALILSAFAASGAEAPAPQKDAAEKALAYIRRQKDISCEEVEYSHD